VGIWQPFRRTSPSRTSPPRTSSPPRAAVVRPPWDGGWRVLAPQATVVRQAAAGVSDGLRFRAGLASWQNPSFASEPGHAVLQSAPAGFVHGVLRPIQRSERFSGGPLLLAVPSWDAADESTVERPVVGARSTGESPDPVVRPVVTDRVTRPVPIGPSLVVARSPVIRPRRIASIAPKIQRASATPTAAVATAASAGVAAAAPAAAASATPAPTPAAPTVVTTTAPATTAPATTAPATTAPATLTRTAPATVATTASATAMSTAVGASGSDPVPSGSVSPAVVRPILAPPVTTQLAGDGLVAAQPSAEGAEVARVVVSRARQGDPARRAVQLSPQAGERPSRAPTVSDGGTTPDRDPAVGRGDGAVAHDPVGEPSVQRRQRSGIGAPLPAMPVTAVVAAPARPARSNPPPRPPAHQPRTPTYPPQAGQYQLQAEAHQPRAAANPPRAEAHEPRVGGHQPREGANPPRPRAAANPLRAGVHQSRTEAYQQRAGAHPPRAEAYEPRAGDHQPQAGASPPRAGAHQPGAEAYQQRAGVHQPRAEAYEPLVGAYPPRADAHQSRAEAYSPRADTRPVQRGIDSRPAPVPRVAMGARPPTARPPTMPLIAQRSLRVRTGTGFTTAAPVRTTGRPPALPRWHRPQPSTSDSPTDVQPSTAVRGRSAQRSVADRRPPNLPMSPTGARRPLPDVPSTGVSPAGARPTDVPPRSRSADVWPAGVPATGTRPTGTPIVARSAGVPPTAARSAGVSPTEVRGTISGPSSDVEPLPRGVLVAARPAMPVAARPGIPAAATPPAVTLPVQRRQPTPTTGTPPRRPSVQRRSAPARSMTFTSAPATANTEPEPEPENVPDQPPLDLDAMARRLIEPVARLLRTELRRGRERAGRPHDGRR
jgi:hypothetical protein